MDGVQPLRLDVLVALWWLRSEPISASHLHQLFVSSSTVLVDTMVWCLKAAPRLVLALVASECAAQGAGLELPLDAPGGWVPVVHICGKKALWQVVRSMSMP